MKKIRMTMPALALVVAVSASAFTTAKKASRVNYFYNSSSTASADILSASKYASGTSSSCNGGTAMPCNVHFDNTQYANLQAWLTAQGSAPNVIANADDTKH